jgi:hypothetical protein
LKGDRLSRLRRNPGCFQFPGVRSSPMKIASPTN